jgi:hypothetical protein
MGECVSSRVPPHLCTEPDYPPFSRERALHAARSHATVGRGPGASGRIGPGARSGH